MDAIGGMMTGMVVLSIMYVATRSTVVKRVAMTMAGMPPKADGTTWPPRVDNADAYVVDRPSTHGGVHANTGEYTDAQTTKTKDTDPIEFGWENVERVNTTP